MSNFEWYWILIYFLPSQSDYIFYDTLVLFDNQLLNWLKSLAANVFWRRIGLRSLYRTYTLWCVIRGWSMKAKPKIWCFAFARSFPCEMSFVWKPKFLHSNYIHFLKLRKRCRITPCNVYHYNTIHQVATWCLQYTTLWLIIFWHW